MDVSILPLPLLNMSLVVNLLAWLGHEICIDLLGYSRFQEVIILFKLHEICSVDSQKNH